MQRQIILRCLNPARAQQFETKQAASGLHPARTLYPGLLLESTAPGEEKTQFSQDPKPSKAPGLSLDSGAT